MGGKKEVGKDIYVISSDGGNKVSNACVLKAHGVLKTKSKKAVNFDLNGETEMCFFAPTGATLCGNFCTLLDGRDGPIENLVVERCTGLTPDLYISKSIDYHQTDYVSNTAASAWIDTVVNEDMDDAIEEGVTNYHFLQTFCEKIELDIVTIRNRGWRMSKITLSEVGKTLREAGYNYDKVYCYVCRTNEKDNAGYWNVHYNRWVDDCPNCGVSLPYETIPEKCYECQQDLFALRAKKRMGGD